MKKKSCRWCRYFQHSEGEWGRCMSDKKRGIKLRKGYDTSCRFYKEGLNG